MLHFKCTCMLCSSSQVGMDAGLFHPCFLCFFQQSLFVFLIFSNIIFTLVSVVFLNPFMDFDSVFKFIQFTSMQVHV